jgi:hypothetical protein
MDAGLKKKAIGRGRILAEKTQFRQIELPKSCTIMDSRSA